MPIPRSNEVEVMVARFLNANHYHETLRAFLGEASLAPELAVGEPNCLTIERLLEEKRQYDAAVVYEKRTERDAGQSWTSPAPSKPQILDLGCSKSNILAVNVPPVYSAWANSSGAPEPAQTLLVSSADRTISIVSMDPMNRRVERVIDLNESHKSPVLSIASISRRTFMTSSMSGHVDILDADGTQTLDRVAHHSKYAVQVVMTPSSIRNRQGISFCIAASAGWDQAICLYSFEPPTADNVRAEFPRDGAGSSSERSHGIGPPKARLSTFTCPESILWIRHPDTDELYLVVGRRDSSYLYYYKITERLGDERGESVELETQEAGRQNLAPYANSWVSFSPSCLASCPTDPTLVAIATSHQPYMKLILVRLLFPAPTNTSGGSNDANSPSISEDAAIDRRCQAMAESALQEREEPAILVHVSTMAPQTPYSRPQVVWRPDGTGVWVNGDDGVIRGLEARTGNIAATLTGHEIGSKVRTLWAGLVKDHVNRHDRPDSDATIEYLVSGGFDKQVVVWEISAQQPSSY